MADIFSSARYVHEEEMETYEVDESTEDSDYGLVLATGGASMDGEALPFEANQYESRLRDIGIYLSTLRRQNFQRYQALVLWLSFKRWFLMEKTKEKGWSIIEGH